MTKLHLIWRINEAIASHKCKSLEPILAIILTKEDKAQLDDEIRTIDNNKDIPDVKEYQEIPVRVGDYSALLIEHKVPELVKF